MHTKNQSKILMALLMTLVPFATGCPSMPNCEKEALPLHRDVTRLSKDIGSTLKNGLLTEDQCDLFRVRAHSFLTQVDKFIKNAGDEAPYDLLTMRDDLSSVKTSLNAACDLFDDGAQLAERPEAGKSDEADALINKKDIPMKTKLAGAQKRLRTSVLVKGQGLIDMVCKDQEEAVSRFMMSASVSAGGDVEGAPATVPAPPVAGNTTKTLPPDTAPTVDTTPPAPVPANSANVPTGPAPAPAEKK